MAKQNDAIRCVKLLFGLLLSVLLVACSAEAPMESKRNTRIKVESKAVQVASSDDGQAQGRDDQGSIAEPSFETEPPVLDKPAGDDKAGSDAKPNDADASGEGMDEGGMEKSPASNSGMPEKEANGEMGAGGSATVKYDTVNLITTLVDWGGGTKEEAPYWEAAVETGAYGAENKVYRVAIFPSEGKLILYDFSIEFMREIHTIKRDAYAKKRDSFIVLQRDVFVPPASGATRSDWDKRSASIVVAFNDIFKYIADHATHRRLVMTYYGHGTGEGDLFGASVNGADTVTLLSKYGLHHAGRKIALLELSGPCRQATMRALAKFADHVDYLYASQVDVQGYAMNGGYNSELSKKGEVNNHYGRLFVKANSTEAILKEFDKVVTTYEWPYLSLDMIAKGQTPASSGYRRMEGAQSKTSIRLASFRSFESAYRAVFKKGFPDVYYPVLHPQGFVEPWDVREHIMAEASLSAEKRAELLSKLNQVVISYVDNNNDNIQDPAGKIYFSWPTKLYGLFE